MLDEDIFDSFQHQFQGDWCLDWEDHVKKQMRLIPFFYNRKGMYLPKRYNVLYFPFIYRKWEIQVISYDEYRERHDYYK